MTTPHLGYFAVVREAGRAWRAGKGITEQPAVSDHAAFMNALADEGFVLLAGPLAQSAHGRFRALLIVNADSEADVHRRLADDPWVTTEQLRTASIEPWTILVGSERLSPAHDIAQAQAVEREPAPHEILG